ncbi:SasC/FmtB family protein [Staphylococcus capitis subsp. urealyticus]
MNLFRKQKFSIRKFNIGIFSALIATVTFLAHPSQASASELDSTQPESSEGTVQNGSGQNVSTEESSAQLNNDVIQGDNKPSTTHLEQSDNLNNSQITGNTLDQTQSLTNNESNELENETNTLATNTNSTIDENAIHVDNTTQHHLEAKTNDKSSKDAKNTSNPITHDTKVVREESNLPKKRSRRDLPAGDSNNANTATTINDPNLSNTGTNSIKTTLTFDDLGITTSNNRHKPEVKVLNELKGFKMINGGSVGLVNSELERTNVFHSGDPRNYQASGNVLVLGRSRGTDVNDHGGFNGVEKDFTVNPNSELMFGFNTMPANNGKGGTYLIVKNADNDKQIVKQDVQDGGIWRLVKIPDNVNRVKVQFLPNNDIMTDTRRVALLKDGYKYYSLIDSIDIATGSHLKVLPKENNDAVKNNKQFEVSTRIENDGNFAAALDTNKLIYTVKLPENFEYIDDSTVATFVNGNMPNTTIKPLSVNYNRQTNTLTFTSNGVNKSSSNQEDAKFLPNKILNIKYKLRPVNIPTPRQVTVNQSITYKTYAQYYLNTNDNTVTAQQTPFTIDVKMNKDDLEEQVNKEVIPSNYTLASFNAYKNLKAQAQTILEEEANNKPINERVSQAEIDSLLHQLQNTLINRVDAAQEINNKAQDMSDEAEANNELTTEEKEALTERIDNDKNEILSKIDDQTTDEGVEQVKNTGLTTLAADTPQPVIKPKAREAINNKVTDQKALINQNNEATHEEKNVAIQKVDNHSSESLQKIGEAETESTVNAARDEGINNISSDIPNPQQKAEARRIINQKAQDKITEINQNTQATQDERNIALNNVNQAKTQALQNIQNANTNNDVTNAKDAAINTINQLSVNPVKRKQAINELNTVAQQQKQNIQRNNEATTEEKTEAESKVERELAQATQNINSASTNNEVDQAKTSGQNAINLANPNTTVKRIAREAVENKVTSQIQQINANNKATNEEKETAINNVYAHKQEALNNVTNAHSNSDVKNVQQDGINTINLDQPNAVKKDQAILELSQKAQERKATLNQTPDATDEEKNAANTKVDQALNDGIQQINRSTSNNDVDNAKTNATQTIDNINVDVLKKPQAKEEIASKVNDKQREITNDNEGTTEEKQSAIESVNQAKVEADSGISQAQTNTEVEKAKNAGLSNIGNIHPVFNKKQQARAKINEKFKTKQDQINQTPNATQEEKNEALTKLTQAKDAVLQTISNSQSNDNVDQAQTNGIQTLDGINTTVNKKPQAKESINHVAQNHNNEIDLNNNATTEEKDDAKNLVNAAITNINNNIDNADTDAQVDSAVANGTQTINSITPATTVKTNAKNEIAKKAESIIAKNQTSPDATDEEKAEANSKVEEAKAEANSNIQIAKSNEQVKEAKDNGLNKINEISPTTTIKSEARKAVQNKVNEQIGLIKATPDATDEEKATAIAKVNSELAKVQQQINTEHTSQGVNSVKANAMTAIEQITAQAIEKETARDAVKQKANEQTDVINNNNNSTEEEKVEAIGRINNAKQEALDNINSATMNQAVTSAKNEGINNINLIQSSTSTKTNAKSDIDRKLSEQIENINQHQTATTEEKDTAVQLANQKANEAKNNIQTATDNEGVAQAKTNGISAINNIEPNAQQKLTAKKDIETKVTEQNRVIDNTTNATDEEKEVAKNLLEASKIKTISSINQAQTNAQVDNAKNTGMDEMSLIHPATTTKTDAKTALDQKAQQQDTIINGNNDATDEEKAKARELVEQAKTEAKNNINSDHTTIDVNNEKTKGIQKIAEIHPATTVKSNAKQELQNKADDQIAQITNTPNATQEEKQDAITEVNTSLAQANQNINQAHSTEEVKRAKGDGINSINDIHAKVNKKQSAINELKQKANEQKQLILANNNATDDEKNAAQAQVDAKLAEEIQNVNNADTNAQVDNVKSKAITAISAINAQPHKRQDAINSLIAQAESKKADIRNNSQATTEEKNTATQSIEVALTKAKAEISNAQTNAVVDEKLEAGKQSLQQIEVSTVTKTTAKADVANAINNKREQININRQATTEEKDEALNQLKQEETKANNAIDSASANQNVNDAKTQYLASIENIQPNIVKKPASNDVINNKVTEQTKLINNNQEATSEEKQAALTKLETAKTSALQNINQASTNDEVQAAENTGVAEIGKIVPETTVKQAAKQGIEQTTQNQINKINDNNNSTFEEKAVAINKVNIAKNEALNNITNATTTQLVQDAKNSGTIVITGINPDTSVKANAIQALSTEAKNKNDLIDQTPNATAEEMEEANNKVDSIQEKANANIGKANTTDEVNQIKAKAIQDMKAVQTEVVKKQNVKEQLSQLGENQKQVINSNTEATKDEKDEAIERLNNELNTSTTQINNASHNSEVDGILNNSRPKIEAITPQARKKRSAIDEIGAKVNAQNSEVDKNKEATLEERNDALNKINQAYEEGKANIKNAQTNDEVDNAKNSSIQKIALIQPSTEVRANDRKALKAKADEQNALIDSNRNATTEEKLEAKELVEQELNSSNYRLKHADTNQDVQNIISEDSKAIANIQPSTDVKDRAKADVVAKSNEKQNEIVNNTEATTEEKEVASQQLQQVTDRTNNSIGLAQDTDQVNVEKNKGIESIKDIQPIIIKKPAARVELDKALKRKQNEVNQLPNATTDELQQALNHLDQFVQEAKTNINQAQTNAQVDQAKENGTNSINTFEPVIGVKQNAIDAINNAKQEKIDRISQAFSATQEEKDKASQFVNEEAQKAIELINKAQTNSQVTEAKDNVINTIKQFEPEYHKKRNAILKLYDIVDAQEAIINAVPDATEDEKQNAIDKVEQLLHATKKEIGLASDNAGVDDIYNNISEQIKTIFPEVVSKSNARTILNNLANQLIKTFENTPDVTTEERDDAINHVKNQLSAVLGAIDKDTRDVQVAQEKVFGLNDLNNIVINVIQKPTARKAINTKADEIKLSINNTPNATDEEKQNALDKVHAIVNDAQNKIREAKADSEVMVAKTDAISLLSVINPEVQVKPFALDEIQQQANNQKSKINNNSEVTKEEKDAAILLVDDLIKQSEVRLDAATKNQQVEDIKNDIINKILNIEPTNSIKPAALKQILAKLDAQKAFISENNDATDEEKAVAIDKLVEASSEYAAKIDDAKTNDEVEAVKNQSIKDIESILSLISKKPQAKLEVQQKAEEIKTTINSNKDATTEEKNAALKTLDELINEADESILSAHTNEEVDKAKALALPKIEAVKVTTEVKPQAKAQIQDVANKKKNEFEKFEDATVEEKQEVLNKLAETVNTINLAIQDSEANADVSKSLHDGLAKLDLIQINAHKKSDAKSYLHQQLSAKIHAVEANSDATVEEKQAFISKLKALVNRIHMQVNDSETNEEVDNSLNNFKVEFEKLKLQTHKKANAKRIIQNKADEIIRNIEDNDKVSYQAKLAAKNLISQILNDSFKEIEDANDNKTVDEVVKQTITKLEAIKVKEDKLNSMESTHQTEQNNKCDNVNGSNNNQHTINELPDTGETDYSGPLAGAALLSGLALLSTRKNKKDKKS